MVTSSSEGTGEEGEVGGSVHWGEFDWVELRDSEGNIKCPR